MPTVKFINEKKTIEVAQGTNLRQAALEAGIELYPGIYQYTNCRGNGMCHSCRVRLRNGTTAGASARGPWERLQELVSWYSVGDPEVRLACQLEVQGDLEVETQPAFNWSGEFA